MKPSTSICDSGVVFELMTTFSPAQSSTTSSETTSCYDESCPSPTTTSSRPPPRPPSSPSLSPTSWNKAKALSSKSSQNNTTTSTPIRPTLKYVSWFPWSSLPPPPSTSSSSLLSFSNGKTKIYISSSQSSTTCTRPTTRTASKYVSQFPWSLPPPPSSSPPSSSLPPSTPPPSSSLPPSTPPPSPIILSTKAKTRPKFNFIPSLMTSHVHRKLWRVTKSGCMACLRPNNKKQQTSKKIGNSDTSHGLGHKRNGSAQPREEKLNEPSFIAINLG